MTPMCQGGNNQTIKISENRWHRLTLFRRRGWQLRLEIARFHLREHWQIFDMFEVIRDPIDEFMAIAPEFFGWHVAEMVSIRFSTHRHATSGLLQGLFKHSPSVNDCSNCHGVMLNAVDDAVAINKALPETFILEFRHNAT